MTQEPSDELTPAQLEVMLAAQPAPVLKKIKATVGTDDVTGTIRLSYQAPEVTVEEKSYFQHRLDTYENE